MPKVDYKSHMADKTKKWGDNAPGKYFVDDQCIDCDACRSEAPESFKRNDAHGYSYVFHQPENEEQEKKAQAALEACPVEAIGKE